MVDSPEDRVRVNRWVMEKENVSCDPTDPTWPVTAYLFHQYIISRLSAFGDNMYPLRLRMWAKVNSLDGEYDTLRTGKELGSMTELNARITHLLDNLREKLARVADGKTSTVFDLKINMCVMQELRPILKMIPLD